MFINKIKATVLGIACSMAIGAAANAAPVFVGSWDLYNADGPSWSEFNTPTYRAIDVAALLWGGSPEDYAISTVGSDPNAIDNMAWLDQIYIGVDKFAEDYVVDAGVIGIYDNNGDTSAWVRDNGCCGEYINYAFRLDAIVEPDPVNPAIPAPGALGLLGLGLVGVGLARRRK